jgi:regulator of sigma E protease
LVWPARVVEQLVVSLSRIITGKDRPQLSGPVGIVKETSRAAEKSWTDYLAWLGILSAYLGGFNLLPFPALDGGRLAFLGYEAVTRRRPNARVEARVHFLGLVMLLALIAIVSVFDVADIRGN